MSKKLSNKPIIKKFLYALFGFKIALKEEKSLVIHLIFSVLTIIISGVLKLNVIEWAIIIMLIGFVICLELINTAIENMIDMISFKYNFNAKKIKDIAAAATLVLAITSVVVGMIIFISRIVYFVNNGY